jgi:flotillin
MGPVFVLAAGINAGVVIGAVVVGFIAILMLFVSNYLKAEPNEALILTGRRYKVPVTGPDGQTRIVSRGWRAVVGGATLKIPVIEKVSRMSLELMNLPEVKVTAAYSREGVPVSIEAVANVKISSESEMLARAVERFLSAPRQQIMQVIRETLEGQLRDIIGVLSVEELYQKREMFVEKVLDQSGDELAKIGVIMDIINIQDIRDDRGYLEALGIKRTAEVKRDAAIGRAEAERDAVQKSEMARREGQVVKAEQERQIAEAERSRDVAKQEYRGQTLSAQHKADQQGPLSEAKARQEVVNEEQRVLEVEQRARMKVEEARAEAESQRYRADVVVPADAEKQAAILRAEGEAQAVIKRKEAEARGIQAVLTAEAEGLREKAEAWNAYGKAAQLNLILEALKIVAEKGAESLGRVKFDKVIAIDGGGGDGASSVGRLMTAAPGALVKFMEQIRGMTGIDLGKLLTEVREQPADTTPAVEAGDSDEAAE